jgi:hypothetical protein
MELTIDLPCFIQSGKIGFRFLRHKCDPWMTLIFSLPKLLFGSEVDRRREQIRCLIAISKINFVGFYSLLNDLL